MKYTVSKEEIQQYFHLPLEDASKKLGVCASVLKRSCRQHGIKRWPYRKIKSLDKKASSLESVAKNMLEQYEQLKNQIANLEKRKKILIVKSANGCDDDTFNNSDNDEDEVSDDAEDIELPASVPSTSHTTSPRLEKSSTPPQPSDNNNNNNNSSSPQPQPQPQPQQPPSYHQQRHHEQAQQTYYYHQYRNTYHRYGTTVPSDTVASTVARSKYRADQNNPDVLSPAAPLFPNPGTGANFPQQRSAYATNTLEHHYYPDRGCTDAGIPGIASLLAAARGSVAQQEQYAPREDTLSGHSQNMMDGNRATSAATHQCDVLYRPFTSFLATIQARVCLTAPNGFLIWYSDSLARELPIAFKPQNLGTIVINNNPKIAHNTSRIADLYTHQYRVIDIRLEIPRGTHTIVLHVHGVRLDEENEISLDLMTNANTWNINSASQQYYQANKKKAAKGYMWFMSAEILYNKHSNAPLYDPNQTEVTQEYLDLEVYSVLE